MSHLVWTCTPCGTFALTVGYDHVAICPSCFEPMREQGYELVPSAEEVALPLPGDL